MALTYVAACIRSVYMKEKHEQLTRLGKCTSLLMHPVRCLACSRSTADQSGYENRKSTNEETYLETQRKISVCKRANLSCGIRRR